MNTFIKPASAIAIAAGLALSPGIALANGAHSQTAAGVFTKPIAGVRDNHWYDYRSDLEEAEIELHKDLKDADSYKDRRRAYREYHREVADARHDYVKEAREKGLLRGTVTVGG